MKKKVNKVKLIITGIVLLVMAIGCSDGNKPTSSEHYKNDTNEHHGHSH